MANEGLRVFRRLQLGLETTAGTAKAATAIWRGDGTYEDGTQRNYVDEAVGYYVDVDRSYEAFTIARLAMDDTPLTFEQFPYLLAASIKNVVTGVADGSGSGKIYTYPLSKASIETLKTYTLEAGDSNQAWEAAYGFCKDFNLSGEGGGSSDAVMMSANWEAREWSKTTYTALSLAAVEEAVFPLGTMYIDAIGGTMGDTNIASTFAGFNLSVDPGVRAMFTGDGQLYFTDAFPRTRPSFVCDVDLLYNSAAQTQVDNWLLGTSIQLELKFEGSTFNTAGSAYTKKTVRIQMPGSWETFSGLDEVEGGDKITGTFRSGYNVTAAVGPSIVVVNALASLT